MMDKEQYNTEFGKMITEKSMYKRYIQKVVELVDKIDNDKKLGQLIREYVEEEFPNN
jgi:uncharacterized protein (UPF0147 family)